MILAPLAAMKNDFNVLIAEDNPDDVFFLEQAFKKVEATSRLFSVQDGAEAVAYLRGEGDYADRTAHPFPDVLLLDLNMPRRNGFEVLEWVRKDPRCAGLIVHVVSASSREADVQRAYGLGANCYIIKPSRFNDLVGFVAALHQWHQFVALPPQSDRGAERAS